MTKDYQELLDATMDVTLRPRNGDRGRLISTVLQWLVDNCSEPLPHNDNIDEFYARMYGSSDNVIYVDKVLNIINDLTKIENDRT